MALKAGTTEIDGPALPETTWVAILFGERDPLRTFASRTSAQHPPARKIRLWGAGHWPWIEAPEAFQRERCGFLPPLMTTPVMAWWTTAGVDAAVPPVRPAVLSEAG